MALVLKNRVKVTSTTTGTGTFTLGSAVDGYQDFSVINSGLSVWDVSKASYSGQFFSVIAQEANSTDLFFKPDGTKMYIIGTTGDDVNEYDLGTAWDVSTASYVQNFSVASQDTVPLGLFFKPDGTKMYVVGNANDSVYEYDLSTAWDISSASYLQLFSVATEDTSPEGLFFKPDGTKMYIAGNTGNDINEYDLGTPWDISTASYLQNFSVNAQDASPTSIFFKPDGMRMYVTGLVNDSVYEYSLSSAWNISTASYVQSFSFANEFLNPEGIFFKPDGTQFFSVGTTADTVYSYYINPVETYYFITDGTDFEAGVGTLFLSTELLRDRVFASSNSNALVNWGAGDKDVVCGYPAEGTPGGIPFCDDSEIGTDLSGWQAFRTAIESGITGGQTYSNPIVSTIPLTFNPFGNYNGNTLSADGWIWFLTNTYDPDETSNNLAYNYLSGQAKQLTPPLQRRARGGVLMPNGDILAVPLNPDLNAYKYSASGVASTYTLVSTSGSYWGGVLSPNGDAYFIPYGTSTVGQKVSAAGVVSTYSLVFMTSNAYRGGVLAPNGDIHFVPANARVGQKVSAAGVVSTYSLVYTTTSAYLGGVLAPNGDIHFVPSTATVGQKVSIDGVVSTYSLVNTTSGSFNGGVLAPNGDIYFIGSVILRISVSGVMSTFSNGFTANSVLAPDGCVYQHSGFSVLKMSFCPGQALGPGVCLSSFLNKL